MRISVTKYGGVEELLTIEIASDMTIRDLKAVIESESGFGIPSNEMNLYHDGKPSNSSFISFEHSILGKVLSDDSQTLEQSNVNDYDVITCLPKPCMFYGR